MKRIVWLCSCVLLLFSSCATLNVTHPGLGRVKKYDFAHKDVPASFNGFTIAFISDLHYKSKFTEKRLRGLVKTINKLHPDLLLMGGDYQEGCQFVNELCACLSEIKTPYGTLGVMGNNDYERCYDDIVNGMRTHGIRILEHELDTVRKENSRIIIAGVRNPFDLPANGVSPSTNLSPDDFVILLTHTPDYAEQVPIPNSDLVLAGHTHGGQVTLFGLYAPVVPSAYGQRFRSGLRHTTAGIPVIITNGIGTSRKSVRLFAPSEVILIRLVALQ